MNQATQTFIQGSGVSYAALLQRLADELEAHPGLQVQLWWSEAEHFGCIRCGLSCRWPWKVQVDEAYYRQWSAAFADLLGQPAEQLFGFEAEQSEGFAHLKKQPGGYDCIMLGSDGSCRIHRRWGSEAKPPGCRTYPFAGTEADGGYYAEGLALSCARAAQMLLEPQVLRYRLIETGRSPRAVMKLDQDSPLSRSGWLIWLGQALDALSQAPDFGSWLTAAGLELSRSTRQQAGPPETLPQLLNWLRELLFRAHPAFAPALAWLEAAIADPAQLRIRPDEARQMEDFLCAYAMRQLVLPPQLLRGELSLIQLLLFIGVQVTLIRLWALYLRGAGPLGPDQLTEAANHVHGFIALNASRQALAAWQALPTPRCLQKIMAIGRWQSRGFDRGPANG